MAKLMETIFVGNQRSLQGQQESFFRSFMLLVLKGSERLQSSSHNYGVSHPHRLPSANLLSVSGYNDVQKPTAPPISKT